MNTIDISVEKILVPAHQVITEELCCWEVTVETNCYGAKGIKIFRKCSKTEIDKIKKGYIWAE